MPPFNHRGSTAEKKHRQRRANVKRARTQSVARAAAASAGPLAKVLETLVESTGDDAETEGYLPVANAAEAEAAMTAVALGAIGTVGHKLPVKARAIGVSGKRLRKVLKHAKQALRDAQTRDGTGVDDGWDDVNDNEDAMEEDAAPAPVAKVGKAAKGKAGKAGTKAVAATRR